MYKIFAAPSIMLISALYAFPVLATPLYHTDGSGNLTSIEHLIVNGSPYRVDFFIDAPNPYLGLNYISPFSYASDITSVHNSNELPVLENALAAYTNDINNPVWNTSYGSNNLVTRVLVIYDTDFSNPFGDAGSFEVRRFFNNNAFYWQSSGTPFYFNGNSPAYAFTAEPDVVFTYWTAENTSSVPEPTTFMLFISALTALRLTRKKSRS